MKERILSKEPYHVLTCNTKHNHRPILGSGKSTHPKILYEEPLFSGLCVSQSQKLETWWFSNVLKVASRLQRDTGLHQLASGQERRVLPSPRLENSPGNRLPHRRVQVQALLTAPRTKPVTWILEIFPGAFPGSQFRSGRQKADDRDDRETDNDEGVGGLMPWQGWPSPGQLNVQWLSKNFSFSISPGVVSGFDPLLHTIGVVMIPSRIPPICQAL